MSARCETIAGVGEATIRELRNRARQVIDRVARGEHITVTSNDEPVAELRPLPRRPLAAAAVQKRFRRLPALDPVRFRADIDATIDESL
jgi:prevent-host-death family protein